MKAIYRIPKGETGTALPGQIELFKGLYRWLFRHCITISFALFLLMIVAPANASGSEKTKKSGCRFKQTSFSYPVIIRANKKSMANNKNFKKSKKRNFSFPV